MKLKTEHYILGAAAVAVGYAVWNKQAAPAVGKKGELGEYINLFEDYDMQPKNLRKITNKYDKLYMQGKMSYARTKQYHDEVLKLGYTFDSGLDNEPYDLRPLGTKGKTELYLSSNVGKKTTVMQWWGNSNDKSNATYKSFKSKKEAKEYIRQERRYNSLYGSEMMGASNFYEIIE
jgi:hypothetical protein